MAKFDILSAASWLQKGNFYVYGDIQIGKTKEIIEVASHLIKNGFNVVYLTQPLNMLRNQTASDFQNPENGLMPALNKKGLCPKLEDRIAWDMLERVSNNKPGLILCDLMLTNQIGKFVESITGPEEYKRLIREKTVVIYDEADIYLSEMEEIVASSEDDEKGKAAAREIAKIERDMSDLNDLVHSTIRITGTICGPFLAAIKASRRPDHTKIVRILKENPHYQNIKNFITTPARPVERTKYSASEDDNIPEFVRSVLARDDEPVALLQIHRHKVKHGNIKTEIEKVVALQGKERETAVLVINQSTGDNSSVAERIRAEHNAGKKYIFLVGGVKLERGIRCASSHCMTDHRHLTDLYILPPKKPIMATLLQQMRLSGSYATNKPRCLLIPEGALSQVQAYYDLQMEFLEELQKPRHLQRTLIKMADDLKYALLISTRHTQTIQPAPVKSKKFESLADAKAFAAKQAGTHVPVISEVFYIPHNFTPNQREDFLLICTGQKSIDRRVVKESDYNEVRRWVYSDADSVDVGDHLIIPNRTRNQVRGIYSIEVNISHGRVCKTYPYAVRFPNFAYDIGDE